MEEIIILVLIVLGLLLIFFLNKLFSKEGLYYSLIILDILSFVLTFKITTVLKMNINIGIVPFIISLSVLYILINKYGSKETKDIFKITLYTNIIIALFLVITNYIVPAITETISINMIGTFEQNYKILILYPIITYISQILISKLYNLVIQIKTSNSIAIILTYVITAGIYTIIFYSIAYIKVMSFRNAFYLGITTYIIGIVITIINIIFINLLLNKKVKK